MASKSRQRIHRKRSSKLNKYKANCSSSLIIQDEITPYTSNTELIENDKIKNFARVKCLITLVSNYTEKITSEESESVLYAFN
jgi:hypothetical protein